MPQQGRDADPGETVTPAAPELSVLAERLWGVRDDLVKRLAAYPKSASGTWTGVAADLDLLKDETADLAMHVNALDEWIKRGLAHDERAPSSDAGDQPPAESLTASPAKARS